MIGAEQYANARLIIDMLTGLSGDDPEQVGDVMPIRVGTIPSEVLATVPADMIERIGDGTVLVVGAAYAPMNDCDCDHEHVKYVNVIADGSFNDPIVSHTIEEFIMPPLVLWSEADPITPDQVAAFV